MDAFTMSATEGGVSYQQQRPQTTQPWPNHLLPSSQTPFPSPPPSDHSHYPFYTSAGQQQPSPPSTGHGADRGSNGGGGGGGGGTGAPQRPGTSSTLSLNLSTLTVTSPSSLSPATSANPSAALSPVTPISPNTNPFGSHAHHHGLHNPHSPHNPHHHNPHNPHNAHSHSHSHTAHGLHHSHFQFDPMTSSQSQSNQQQHQGQPGQEAYDSATPSSAASSTAASTFDHRRTTPGPSRSSSASTASSLPRKRSFSNNSSAASLSASSVGSVGVGGTLVEESMYDVDARDAGAALDLAAGYADDIEMRPAPGVTGVVPFGGPQGTGSADGNGGSGSEDHPRVSNGVGGCISVLGKPMATNNFVTKLYQMINDPKSQHFISWTELGTSFVVSNVGEFSRSILGAHFKHNNFSSFVRQLNMYGFHKINRTPRAQRTSTDAQTWEFSHHKFLRGRPDLLDEIKRKALEPDPAVKHRVELPGEVASQLNAMRDENRRMWEQLNYERRRVEKLVGLVTRLWDVVSKNVPGALPSLPPDVLEHENPNIYITSPTTVTSRFPPPLSINNLTGVHVHSGNTPNSSPTGTDFSSHIHHNHHHGHPSLSRQQSIQHISFSRGNGTADGLPSSSSTPLQASPRSMSMDFFDDVSTTSGDPSPNGRSRVKRQRLSTDDGPMHSSALNGSSDSLSPLSSVSSPATSHGPAGLGLVGLACAGSAAGGGGKKNSRARSESAPLGYHGGFGGLATTWGTGSGALNCSSSTGNLVGQVGGSFCGITGRPRSGSGLVGLRGVPNIGTMTRGGAPGVPLLTIQTVPNETAR